MTDVRAAHGSGRPRKAMVAAAVGVSLIALVTGCGRKIQPTGLGALGAEGASPSTGAAPFATPTGTTSTPTTPATATTAPPTTSHTSAPANPYPSDYAAAILTAWGGNDNTFLTLLTTASIAHHLLHDLGGPDQHWTHIGGEGAAGATVQTFYNQDGDEVTIKTNNAAVAARHWHAGSLQSWNPMAYPSDDQAYVTAFVKAWIAGNRTRMELLASQSVTTHFLTLATPDSLFTVAEVLGSGAAGRVEVKVTDSATSLVATLIIATPVLGMAHAIENCDPSCG